MKSLIHHRYKKSYLGDSGFFNLTSYMSAFHSDSDSSWLALSFLILQSLTIWVSDRSFCDKFWDRNFWIWFLQSERLIFLWVDLWVESLNWFFFSGQNSYILQSTSEAPLSLDHSSDFWNTSLDHRYSNFQS